MKDMYSLLICLSLFFVSCEKNYNSTKKDDLIGTWKLDSAYFKNDDTVKHLPDALKIEILFEFINSSDVKLFGYCNIGSASYILKDNSITFENVNLTEKACPYAGGEWEEYLYELTYINTFELEGLKLNLISETSVNLFLSKVIN